jgi:hypothetical protein
MRLLTVGLEGLKGFRLVVVATPAKSSGSCVTDMVLIEIEEVSSEQLWTVGRIVLNGARPAPLVDIDTVPKYRVVMKAIAPRAVGVIRRGQKWVGATITSQYDHGITACGIYPDDVAVSFHA